MIDRRVFLLTGVAGAASSLLPTLSLAALTIEKNVPEAACYHQWQPMLGENFVVEESGRQLTQLKLSELREGTKAPRLNQFHLYFTNTSDVTLEERSYHLHHAVHGSHYLFLQPVMQSSGNPVYRTTFCLLDGDACYT